MLFPLQQINPSAILGRRTRGKRINYASQEAVIAEFTKFTKSRYPTTLHFTVTLETVLLQLNFPAFLRESTRTAAKHLAAVAHRASTNAIAIANLATRANLGSAGGVRGCICILSTSQHTCMIQPKPANASRQQYTKQSLLNIEPPPRRGVPWVAKLRRRSLFWPKTMHGQHQDMKPTAKWVRKVVSILYAKTARIWCWLYVQVPQLPKQSHKPWLQSRFPSCPTGRFAAFLLPPTCIGTVPCKNTQNGTWRNGEQVSCPYLFGS